MRYKQRDQRAQQFGRRGSRRHERGAGDIVGYGIMIGEYVEGGHESFFGDDGLGPEGEEGGDCQEDVLVVGRLWVSLHGRLLRW